MRTQQWLSLCGKFLMISMLLMTMSPGAIWAEDDLYETLQVLKFDEPTESPDFSLMSVDGSEKKLSDFKGQIVLLNFWATWCMYCRSERDALQSVYNLYKDQGLSVISVSIDHGDIEPVKAFVEEKKLTFSNLHDPNNQVSSQYAARAIPMTYFLNREGKAIGFVVGPRPWDSDEMKSLLEQMLKEEKSSEEVAQSADATPIITPTEDGAEKTTE